MKFSEAVDKMMAGKPITRQFFRETDNTLDTLIRTEPYIRYNELWDKFEFVWADGRTYECDNFILNGELLCADDWLVGEFHPVTGECRYENDK